MKDINKKASNISAIAALIILLSGNLLLGGDPKPSLVVYYEGKQFVHDKETLPIDAEGKLTLVNLFDSSQKVKFYVVIRHQVIPGTLPIVLMDERYEDGKILESVEVEKILNKIKPGDKVLIIPIDPEKKFENSAEPIRIAVGGGC
jgi:hypothetical protein